MNRGASLIFNILTVAVLLLTCLCVATYGLIALNPNSALNPLRPRPLPTAFVLPTATATSLLDVFPTPITPSVTPTPTDTGEAGSATASSTPGPSPTASDTPTATATATPEASATSTPIPSATATNTPSGPTLTPTRTLSAFPFTMQTGNPTYQPNFANTAGCNWLGVAGQVFDLNNQPYTRGEFIVRITFPGGSLPDALVGSKPVYGAGGYEIFLSNQPTATTDAYQIVLLDSRGTQVSSVYPLTTFADCNKNLIIVNFVQNH